MRPVEFYTARIPRFDDDKQPATLLYASRDGLDWRPINQEPLAPPIGEQLADPSKQSYVLRRWLESQHAKFGVGYGRAHV